MQSMGQSEQASAQHGNVWMSDVLKDLYRQASPASADAPVEQEPAEVKELCASDAPPTPDEDQDPIWTGHERVRLRRDGLRPMVFEGQCLAFASSVDEGALRQELVLYVTSEGELIAHACVKPLDERRFRSIHSVMELRLPGDIAQLAAFHDPGRAAQNPKDVDAIRRSRLDFALICKRICLWADASPKHEKDLPQ